MKIVIAGAGAVGTHLSKLLSTENHDCVLIDDDDERLGTIDGNYDIMALCSSPTSIKTLKDAGVANADLFVGVTRRESSNITACMLAHALGAKKTVARIDNYEYLQPQHLEYFRQVGVDSLVYPEVLAASDIISGLKHSWVRQRLEVHNGALLLLGVKLRDTCQILGQPIKDLCGPDDPYHIVALKRGEETIIPSGLDVLQNGDLAYFMTTPEYIPYIKRIVGKEKYEDVHNVIIMGGGKTSVRAALTLPDNMHSIAGVGEERLLGSLALLVQSVERCPRHQYLATNLELVGVASGCQHQRYRTDGLHVACHIIALHTITTGDGLCEPPVDVCERDAQPVVLQFATHFEVIAAQALLYTVEPLSDVVGVVGVG